MERARKSHVARIVQDEKHLGVFDGFLRKKISNVGQIESVCDVWRVKVAMRIFPCRCVEQKYVHMWYFGIL